MAHNDPKRLRGHLRALSGQLRALERMENPRGATVVDANTVELVFQEVDEVQRAFPGLVPPFRGEDFFSHDVGHGAYYKLSGLVLYLHKAVGHLEVALEEEDESSPVTEAREFAYVEDQELRAILVRDYLDIQRAFIATSWKATIILAGGAIEAILLDLVQRDATAARAAKAAPKQPDLTRWDLSDLINVSVELRLVGPGVEKLSHSVREYRNLVHPGNEVRNKIAVGKEEARIAIEVLNLVDRGRGA